MAERNKKKTRKCSRCGKSFSSTAAEMKTHFTGCPKRPEVVKTLKKEV